MNSNISRFQAQYDPTDDTRYVLYMANINITHRRHCYADAYVLFLFFLKRRQKSKQIRRAEPFSRRFQSGPLALGRDGWAYLARGAGIQLVGPERCR